MVNVPGRSKGCNTCRQRKIACSLEKPQCQRCIKSKLFCSGYRRERIFIADPRSAEAKSTQKLTSGTNHIPSTGQENEVTCPSQCLLGDARVSAESAVSQFLFRAPGHFDPKIQPTNPIPPLNSIQQVPTHAAFRQQLFAQFYRCYMPVDQLDENTRRNPEINGTWLSLFPSLQNISPALEFSILALCTAFLGRMHDDVVLVQHSLVFHGRALWALQKALWDSNAMYKDETLAACIALTMYEATERPGGNNSGWTSHMDGCATLIRQRGAEAHLSTLGHRLFLWYRISGLMESIVYSRPTYLSDPEWISVPWRYTPKPLLHQLIDITSQLARILAQSRKVNPNNIVDLSHVGLDNITRCWRVEASLRHFYNKFNDAIAGQSCWILQSTDAYKAVNLDHDTLFSNSIHFNNLLHAYTFIMYWATEILLWLVLSHLYLAFGSNLPTNCPPIATKIDIEALCHNICRSVPYFLQSCMGTLGPSLLAIPLIAIIGSLKNIPEFHREVTWAKMALHKVRAKGLKLIEDEHIESERRGSGTDEVVSKE